MYMCHMHVGMHVSMWACICVHVSKWACICVHVSMRVCRHTYTPVCIDTTPLHTRMDTERIKDNDANLVRHHVVLAKQVPRCCSGRGRALNFEVVPKICAWYHHGQLGQQRAPCGKDIQILVHH